jgi:hypothetical protein
MTRPERVTDRTAPAWLVMVVVWMSPPGRLCRPAPSAPLFLGLGAVALLVGAAGDIAGAAATASYAHAQGWAIVIPPEAWAAGLGAALLIGALAGLLPAIRAARLTPTQALWTL